MRYLCELVQYSTVCRFWQDFFGNFFGVFPIKSSEEFSKKLWKVHKAFTIYSYKHGKIRM